MRALFFRVLEEPNEKGDALRRAIRPDRQAAGSSFFDVNLSTLGQVPGSPFSYWASDSVRGVFPAFPPFEGQGRTAKQGLITADDLRFVRLWSEVPAGSRGRRWFPFAKGGRFSPFTADIHLLVNWADDGRELRDFRDPKSGRAFSRTQNTEYYFRPGLTWPLRAHRFAPQALPAGCIFSARGYGAFAPYDSLLSLLTVCNSSVFDSLFKLSLGRFGYPEFVVGRLNQMPWPTIPECWLDQATALARRAWSLRRHEDSHNEVSLAFLLPALIQMSGESLSGRSRTWGRYLEGNESALSRIQSEIDERTFALFGIGGLDRDQLLRVQASEAAHEEPEDDGEAADGDFDSHKSDTASLVASLLSWAVGVALGRFDLRLATRKRLPPPEPEPFDALPACSPGMLTGANGLPLEAPPASYPIDFPRDGILDDAADSKHNLAAKVYQVFEEIFPDAVARWEEAAEALGEEDHTLRTWFTRKFFALHLKHYSKSGRKAPLYWPLSTASGSFTVWLYCPRLTADTLFQVVSEHLEPKLRMAQEERARAEAGQSRAEGREAAKLAKRAGELVELEQELEEMRAELLRVAQLPYKPDLNDGVQITAAPLWRLFRLPAWRKVLEDTWKKLEKGEYDWAHLAMAIWPERVREKATADKSLAIAHGLDCVPLNGSSPGAQKKKAT